MAVAQTVVQQVPVVHTVVQNHTVYINQLGQVVNVVLGVVSSAAALSVAHWVVLNDRLSKGQNKALASVYALVVGLLATLAVNKWNVPIDLSSAGELVAFGAAALGSAQGVYNVITAKSSPSEVKGGDTLPTADPSTL